MKNTYIFPALVEYADDGISISFPDLPGCFSCAFSSEKVHHNAQEAMGLHLYGMEKDGEIIPAPSDVSNLPHPKNSTYLLVEVFMPPVRERISNRAKKVKKTVSIPQWLSSAAERAGLNFSQVLQTGLESYLRAAR
jgi:predicted RNase H-like HicB family nuclease